MNEGKNTRSPRMLVVGAGAVGGYFGGRYAQAGRDVTFLVRPARAERLRAEGLQIVSPMHGDATIDVKVVTADAIDGPYDVIVYAIKGYTLDSSLDDFAPAVGPGTMILPLLNGMRHLDVLDARFGSGAVLGGYCYCATTLDEAGRIVQLGPMQTIVFGERDGTPSERVAALEAMLGGTAITARSTLTILHEMWEKWVLLAASGGITCLMRGNVGQVASSAGGKAFALAFFDEVAATAAASGYPMTDAYLAQKRAALTDETTSTAPSMFRDLQQGLDVEADQMLGDLLDRARRLGVAAPLIATAYTNLKVYQLRR